MFNRFRALGTGAVLKILSDEQVIKCSKVVSKGRERNEAACRQRTFKSFKQESRRMPLW